MERRKIWIFGLLFCNSSYSSTPDLPSAREHPEWSSGFLALQKPWKQSSFLFSWNDHGERYDVDFLKKYLIQLIEQLKIEVPQWEYYGVKAKGLLFLHNEGDANNQRRTSDIHEMLRQKKMCLNFLVIKEKIMNKIDFFSDTLSDAKIYPDRSGFGEGESLHIEKVKIFTQACDDVIEAIRSANKEDIKARNEPPLEKKNTKFVLPKEHQVTKSVDTDFSKIFRDIKKPEPPDWQNLKKSMSVRDIVSLLERQ